MNRGVDTEHRRIPAHFQDFGFGVWWAATLPCPSTEFAGSLNLLPRLALHPSGQAQHEPHIDELWLSVRTSMCSPCTIESLEQQTRSPA